MVNLTEEEKRAVSMQIHTKPSVASDVTQYGMWLLPVVGFAVYGVYQLEPVAIGFAFTILLAMAIWFLSYSHNHAVHLSSALEKYENEVGALNEKSDEP